MEYGRYRIIKELGKGTMGVVYQAHDPQIDRMVALKVLRPDRVTSEDFVARFLKEARAIGRLSHPQIVTIYDVGEDKGTIYIAMEYLKGEPFEQVVRSGRLTVPKSIDIARQVAEALDYAHGKGIIHRDIKPSNIILALEDRVKLTDFGIARIEDLTAGYQTQAGEILGTPIYMAPEQVAGKKVDGRSDLYALGVILYEMIAGRRPFTGSNIASIFRAITLDEPEPPSAIDPFLSKPISDLIMKSLAKRPDDRFQTGRQMADALRSVVHQDKKASVPHDGTPEPAKKPFLMVALAIVLLASIATAGYYYFRPRPDAPTNGRNVVSTDDTKPDPERAAMLMISSEPVGAQIYVDNIFKGRTPLDVPVQLGKHEVRLNLPDHLEWEAQVNLDTPGETPLHIPLRPIQ